MVKTQRTEQGKTWAGRVTELTPATRSLLSVHLAKLEWTGGGEIEMVRRQQDGQLYLIDVNPRFPAWIHGATVVGCNLPAHLVASATGINLPSSRGDSQEFVRVVDEIPAKFPQRPMKWGVVNAVSLGKMHPSDMPGLARRLNGGARAHGSKELRAVPGDDPTLQSMSLRLAEEFRTPHHAFLSEVLNERLIKFTTVLKAVSRSTGIDVVGAYSVKTNPNQRVVESIKNHSLLAECISLSESDYCLALGIDGSHIVLNGPAKWWPITSDGGGRRTFYAVNCDSYEDLKLTAARLRDGDATTYLGARICPPSVTSRFGFDVGAVDDFLALARGLVDANTIARIGVHYHVAPSSIGSSAWLSSLIEVLKFCRELERTTGLQFRMVDLGGGAPAKYLDSVYRTILEQATNAVIRLLPNVAEIVCEPGKMLVEPSMVTLTTVISVTRRSNRRVVVIDASIADVPDASSYPHRLWWKPRDSSKWYKLDGGHDVVYGRLCMENDVVRTSVYIPDLLASGDLIAILDTGGYDYSMKYTFGSGE